MFWLFAAALTLTVALAILMPFWRARPDGAEPAAAYDLRVYRDQLAEIDRDLARGHFQTRYIGQGVMHLDRQTIGEIAFALTAQSRNPMGRHSFQNSW